MVVPTGRSTRVILVDVAIIPFEIPVQANLQNVRYGRLGLIDIH